MFKITMKDELKLSQELTENARRNFLKKVAFTATGAVALSLSSSEAKAENILSDNRDGVLVDTTVCVGCRNCEFACKKAHELPTANIESYSDRSVFIEFRRPDGGSLTVVNEFVNEKNPLLPIDVKFQCMHCDKPACVSACIVGAISKKEDGSVVWDSSKCIGCRYCMVACPFQIPSFDYLTPIEPNIRKCDFCYERKQQGKLPACVEICPVEALIFSSRTEILRVAKEKLKRYPERYFDHIYGENEVNGTGWVYLASKNFYDIGFPKLSYQHAPGVSEAIQHGIFAYFVPPVLFYSILGTLMWINKRRIEIDEEGEE